MTVIVGVVGAAFLFGLFSLLRPRENGGCTGHCAGCTGDKACETTERNNE
jgi:FeoB-associated Cys-rich membrane protein